MQSDLDWFKKYFIQMVVIYKKAKSYGNKGSFEKNSFNVLG